MSTGFTRIAALAVPVLLAAACTGGADEEAGTMPADTGMYAPPPPPPPPVTDTSMMSTDTMATDTMGTDTTGTQ
jgi:hypothetical protein